MDPSSIIIKQLAFNPIFLIGLALRLILIVSITPFAVEAWYVPFLSFESTIFTLDPWTSWLDAGGSIAAFPYGYVMWLAFSPIIFISKLIGLPLHYGYELTLIIADLCLLFILNKLLPNRQRLLLLSYWLSPIIIFACYGLGYNDVIPALLLTLSIFFIKRIKLKLAGVIFAAAISAKLSMVIALPFFVIYLYNHKALRQRLSIFFLSFCISSLIFGVPILFSGAGLEMILGSPEMDKIYSLAINMGGQFTIYVVPFIYLVTLYWVWRIKRLNFDLFQATIGMAFLLIVLMSPASPGWFVWCMPFLAFYQAMSGRIAIILVGLFSVLYVISSMLIMPLQFSNGILFDLNHVFNGFLFSGAHTVSILQTTMVAIGLLLAIRIWREAISRNDFYRLSRNPFLIGIAGDSGSGKDTLSDAIAGLFGRHSVAKISGDDYHLWDREKPMWQMTTHLNPMTSDLESYTRDLISLSDGKPIQSRLYDHQIGKMSRLQKIESNDFIISSGLHALYLPILRDCYNLKIYLDMDEGLRRYLKLKRDIEQRGYSMQQVLSNFKKREVDSERFIRPQKEFADLIISLRPVHRLLLEDIDIKQVPRLKLEVKTRHALNERALNRVLVGVCGLHVDIEVSDGGGEVRITIEGETSAADIEMASIILCPNLMEFLDLKPKWEDGVIGLMQLITISHISQVLTKRFIQ